MTFVRNKWGRCRCPRGPYCDVGGLFGNISSFGLARGYMGSGPARGCYGGGYGVTRETMVVTWGLPGTYGVGPRGFMYDNLVGMCFCKYWRVSTRGVSSCATGPGARYACSGVWGARFLFVGVVEGRGQWCGCNLGLGYGHRPGPGGDSCVFFLVWEGRYWGCRGNMDHVALSPGQEVCCCHEWGRRGHVGYVGGQVTSTNGTFWFGYGNWDRDVVGGGQGNFVGVCQVGVGMYGRNGGHLVGGIVVPSLATG